VTLNLNSEVEEGFHRTRNVRWETVSPLRDGKKRRPTGRNDRFYAVDDVGETDFVDMRIPRTLNEAALAGEF